LPQLLKVEIGEAKNGTRERGDACEGARQKEPENNNQERPECGGVTVSDEVDPKMIESFTSTATRKLYQLSSVICGIRGAGGDCEHISKLVTFARVAPVLVDTGGPDVNQTDTLERPYTADVKNNLSGRTFEPNSDAMPANPGNKEKASSSEAKLRTRKQRPTFTDTGNNQTPENRGLETGAKGEVENSDEQEPIVHEGEFRLHLEQVSNVDAVEVTQKTVSDGDSGSGSLNKLEKNYMKNVHERTTDSGNDTTPARTSTINQKQRSAKDFSTETSRGESQERNSGSGASPMTSREATPLLDEPSQEDHLQILDWVLYNDIAVNYVDSWEATHFDMDWKIPCLLYYHSVEMPDAPLSLDEPVRVSDSALFETNSLTAGNNRLSSSSCIPLDPEEVPRRGDLVAMDAEFVTLNQQESELRTDGSTTVQDSMMSAARVTCIRCSGALEGTPFIDDYILTQEKIADYKTAYSGIKPGDLDVAMSSKHLTTLKTTYLKLRYLIDAGVIFVGHGLKNDFRVINLYVPDGQIIDTVKLFKLPRCRMISLRFLAWYFLGIKIQVATHDSAQDARTALQLYRKYQALMSRENGGGPVHFAAILDRLYLMGRKMEWKVPE
jgi:hypothetical protein